MTCIRLVAIMALAAVCVSGCVPSASRQPAMPSDPGLADAWITQQVLARLDGDEQLRPFFFHVQTSGRVVWVQGAVPNEQLRARVGQVVLGTPLVRGVQNNVLAVGQPLPPQ